MNVEVLSVMLLSSRIISADENEPHYKGHIILTKKKLGSQLMTSFLFCMEMGLVSASSCLLKTHTGRRGISHTKTTATSKAQDSNLNSSLLAANLVDFT